MSNKKKISIEELMLEALHGSLETILDRIKSGTVTHQEMEVMRKMLADNNVNIKLSSTPRGDNLLKNLPFDVEEDFRN